MSAPLHDVVVISDLHLGRGKNPDTGRYYSLEAFFYDDDLRRFCGYLCNEAAARNVGLKVVLNGDVFDLLRIEPDEPPPDASRRERRFGTPLTPEVAARLAAQVLAGHPGFVEGLAQLLEAGIELIFLPGNHDIEVQWEPVQSEVRRAVLARVRERAGAAAAESAAAGADTRLRFAPWFYHEPGRLWVEHGCQYDPENAFRYLLRGGLARTPEDALETERDVPLGNFFQRYLYNAFGHITFIVPSTRANYRYFRWLLANQPALIARVAKSHAPFILQLVRRLARGAAGPPEALRRCHQKELSELAAASGLGDKLHDIDALKRHTHDIVQAVRAIGWQFVKFVGLGYLTALALAGLWFAGFHSINQLRYGFGPKTLLFLALTFFLLAVVALGVGYAVFRGPEREPPAPLRRAAGIIANLLEVPIVTFGHTHDEALWRLERRTSERSWYFNTGTWIAVFTHDVLMPRERVQFTFLRVRDKEGELLQWSPGRGEPAPVILLDEEPWVTPQHPPAGV